METQRTLPTGRMLARSVAVFGGAQAVTVVAALVRSKVAAVTIGPEGAGLNAILVTVLMFVSQLMGLGLAGSGVKYLSGASDVDRRVARLRLWGVLTSVVAGVVMLVSGPFLSRVYMGGYDGWWQFWLLAPAVSLQIACQIEQAVLRSLHQTRRLALSMVVSALLSVLLSVPFFWLMGVDGVIWAVTCSFVASSLYVCWLGVRAAPWRVRLGDMLPLRQFVAGSRALLTLGFAFLLTGIVWQGVELATQTVLALLASKAVVGLYKYGFQIGVSYPAMLFTAVSNDFYPRLAAVSGDIAMRNRLVCRQVAVLLCITVPLIALFWWLMPWVVPLLLSDDFLPIVPMARWATLAVVVRAVYMPISYLPLAMGRARHFSVLETWSLLQKSLCVLGGYWLGGLVGSGMGILLSECLDLAVMGCFAYVKYGFRLR